MTNIPIQGSAIPAPSPLLVGLGSLSRSLASNDPASASLSGLQVVADPGQATSDQPAAKGVLVQGAFVPVNFPDEVELGDKVNLKQVTVAGESTLQFVSLTDEKNVEAPASDSSIKTLLSALKVNRESIDTLRQLLVSTQQSQITESGKQLVLSDALVKLLQASGIAQAKGGQSNQVSKEALLNPADRALIDLLARVVKNREQEPTSGSTKSVVDQARQIFRELEG